MKLNNVDYLFDATDADTLERYLTAMDKVREESATVEDPGEDIRKIAESYRYMCGVIRRFFDAVFGDGAGVAICGERESLKIHQECLIAIIEEYDRQMEAENVSIEKIAGLMGAGAQV